MAKIHVEYYNGREHYSEGDVVEQDILNYVSNYTEEEYPLIFEKDSRWTVFYHLTDIRKAILAWYPFEKSDSILEIGAGMGALTGLLCERCGKVTAVELTKIRAQTIYKRYEEKNNLDIYIGNILDMEFEERFDYISLIGVLEYQENYNDGKNPYIDFLKTIQKFLKPNGKILVAIENRFGIKYWCGVPEDHTGIVYDSINNYPQGGKAKTFSKQELELLLNEASLQNYKFFYPMPDYKLPQVILSEGNLPEENMPSRIIPYYLYYPTLIASEKNIYSDLLRNHVFDFFANSFLVECGIGDASLCDVTMATVTADRKQTHQMCTVIHNNEYVEKFPVTNKGKSLLTESYENILKIKNKNLSVVNHELVDSDKKSIHLSMPYMKLNTLDETLISLAKSEKREEFFELFNEYYKDILKSSDQILDENNSIKVDFTGSDLNVDFGPILDTGFIDFIPHNCFVTETGNRLYYDQEFTVGNLPAKFMVFRGIKNLYSFYPWLEKIISAYEVKNYFEINEELWDIFEKQDQIFLHELWPKSVSQILGSFWYVDDSIFNKNATLLMDGIKIQEEIIKLKQKEQCLEEQVELVKKENKTLIDEIDKTKDDLKNWLNNEQNLSRNLKDEIVRNNVVINKKNEEIQELKYKIKGMFICRQLHEIEKGKEIKYLQSQSKELYDKTVAIEEDAKVYRKLFEDINNSTSWQMTASLRKFKDCLKGIKLNNREAALPELEYETIKPYYDVSQDLVPEKAERPIPESGISGRPLVEQLVEMLIPYDIVSFDVFDTLLFRIFERPIDVFKLVGLKLGFRNFYKLRVMAEIEARNKSIKKNSEIDIYDIYQYLEKYICINKNEALLLELQTEKECLYANPYMQEVFTLLKKAGKKIIFISDMYWPNKFVREMLCTCGFEGFADGFVSCDFQCNKGMGELQKIVKDKYRDEKIIHLGDNLHSDIYGSQLVKWDTFFYENCQDIGQAYRPKEHESLVSSVYNGLVNRYVHNGLNVYSPNYEYGFLYGGLLVCGFCEWLNNFAEQNKIDQILFLARDCEIIEKVYNMFYKKADNVYVKTSRLAMWQLVFEDNTEDFIQNFFKTRALRNDVQIEDAVKKIGLDCILKYMPYYGLDKSSILDLDSYEIVRNLIYDKKNEIVKNFSTAHKAAKKYFSEIIKEKRRICVVDLGWSGQILVFLEYFLKKHVCSDCSVIGAYVAATTDEMVNLSVGTQLLNSYVFSYMNNRDIRLRTNTVEGSMTSMFLEAMFSSTQPTLIGYSLDTSGGLEFIYGHCTGNAENINQIHQGIIDFARLYNSKIEKNKQFFSISGSEAFAPFNQVANNFKYNYEIFKDYKELSFPLPQIIQDNECTTIGDIIKMRNLL